MELSLSRRRRQKSPGENTSINSSDFLFLLKKRTTNKHKSLCSSKVDTIMQAYIYSILMRLLFNVTRQTETRENANRIEVN